MCWINSQKESCSIAANAWLLYITQFRSSLSAESFVKDFCCAPLTQANAGVSRPVPATVTVPNGDLSRSCLEYRLCGCSAGLLGPRFDAYSFLPNAPSYFLISSFNQTRSLVNTKENNHTICTSPMFGQSNTRSRALEMNKGTTGKVTGSH